MKTPHPNEPHAAFVARLAAYSEETAPAALDRDLERLCLLQVLRGDGGAMALVVTPEPQGRN